MYKVTIVAILLQVSFAQNVRTFKGNDTNIGKKATGFLLSMPRSLVSGKNETVCLSLHEAKLPAKILIDLKWKGNHYPTLKTIHSDTTCFKLSVPLRKMPEPQFVSVRVQVQINRQVYTAHNQDPVLVHPGFHSRVFVETDRGIYKPGDAVKFLILRLDRSMRPLSQKITEVRIKNPMGLTVAAWNNLTTNHGLVSLEYQMPPESMIGKWKLRVEGQTRHFEVAKYSVARFKIELMHPKTLYFRAEAFTISVCAKYSYNKPVAGLAFVKVSSSLDGFQDVDKLSEMVLGCAHFTLNHTELGLKALKLHEHPWQTHLHLTATVTEFGTNKMDVTTGRVELSLQGFQLRFSSSSIFIPGVPYEGQLQLTKLLIQPEMELVEICCHLAIKKSWNLFNDKQCQNYTVSSDGTVAFRLWPLKEHVLHVHLHARSVNRSSIATEFKLVRMFSPSASHVQLKKEADGLKPCNNSYRYAVTFGTLGLDEGKSIQFFYKVKTGAEILQMGKHEHTVGKPSVVPADASLFLGRMHKYVKLGLSLESFTLNFTISQPFVSRYTLLVYYVTKSGETVAATESQDVPPCAFQISSQWDQDQVLPGSTASLTINATAPALCAVSATDKSAKLMAANSNRQVSLERLLRTFAPGQEDGESDRNSCLLNGKKPINLNTWMYAESLQESGRKKRQDSNRAHLVAEDFDASDVFSAFGTTTITNFQTVTKSCFTDQIFRNFRPASFVGNNYETAHEDGSQATIRSFFPENWLWELVPVGTTVQLERPVPHSITSWLTNVWCVSEQLGVGFAAQTELTSFQAFFVEVLTPHSIKKGENFSLLVHVSNYVNYSFPIRISIRLSDNLVLKHQMAATYCLKGNSTQTQNYPIEAAGIGSANLTVLVESESQYPFACGPETIVSKRDVVFKSFQVEPEGYHMTNTQSAFLCASKPHFQSNVTWTVSAPSGIVAGTQKVALALSADLLTQSIQNLHQLLTIPTGCGEQIMASMAPNLYVLRYLNATDSLTAGLKQKVLRNLKLGYQRILNYAHADGSFSAFGYFDPSGSMFLTTFVVRVLQEAKSLIYVDAAVLDRAVRWIFQHQLENGCFDTMHHVFQDMGGTNLENSTAGLTAYVILSLFDAKVDVPDAVQVDAKYCIRSQNNPDQYSMVISSYALFKVQWVSEASRFLEMAVDGARKENGLMWWSSRESDESAASDIEVTSYALLACLEQKSATHMAYAHSIAQWLISKMGPLGGFRSTQDTIVALDGLTKYAQQTRADTLDLNILVNAWNQTHGFQIADPDRLKSRQLTLSTLEGQVGVSLTGTGCALAQLTNSYFSTSMSESEAFRLDVEVGAVSDTDQCSVKSISPCLSYQGPGQLANMAVMELALPSGFQADRSSLYDLLDGGTAANIKMFEEKDDQINIYFTSLGRRSVCFTIKISENLPVENRKESLVKLYDYYRPEQNILRFYSLVNNCSMSSLEQDRESGKPGQSSNLDMDLEAPNCR